MLTRMTNGIGLGGTLSPLLRLPDDMNRLFEGFFERQTFRAVLPGAEQLGGTATPPTSRPSYRA